MARETSLAVRVLAVVSLAALADHAWCQVALAHRALPPTVACGAEGSFPDPTDCHYFINCTGDSSTPTISQCSDGAYYDPCNGTCSSTNPPDQCIVECTADNSITTSRQNPAIIFVCHNSSGQFTITVSNCSSALEGLGICSSNAPQCTVNNGQGSGGPPLCKDIGTGYHVDKNNCSVYYYCSGTNATVDVGVCGAGEYFNMSIHRCTKFQCYSVGVFADPLNCSWYYTCVENGSGYAEVRALCKDGGHFDSSVGKCVPGSCTTVCPVTKFSCPSSGHFADPDSYSSYYYCDNNLQAAHFSCPGRSHFDSVAGGCLMGSYSNGVG